MVANRIVHAWNMQLFFDLRENLSICEWVFTLQSLRYGTIDNKLAFMPLLAQDLAGYNENEINKTIVYYIRY